MRILIWMVFTVNDLNVFIIKLICGDSVQRNIEKISKRDMASLSILLSVIQVFPQVILQKAILIHLRNH